MVDNRFLIRWMSWNHVLWYRLTRGILGGRLGRARLLLLTTTGSKTGKQRTTPLIFVENGDSTAVIASNAGNPKDPAWWGNLKKNPTCEVQIGGRKQVMRARPATSEEYPTLWEKLVSVYPTYETYKQRTQRHLPIVVLSPAS